MWATGRPTDATCLARGITDECSWQRRVAALTEYGVIPVQSGGDAAFAGVERIVRPLGAGQFDYIGHMGFFIQHFLAEGPMYCRNGNRQRVRRDITAKR